MSTTLEKALEAAKTLPPDRQEFIGQWVRDFVMQEQSTLALTEAQQRVVKTRLEDSQPVYASSDQIAALLAKFAG